jgi:hypothetical protein
MCLTEQLVLYYVLLTVHLDILYKENQKDALLILNIFCQSTSTCFRHVYRPSSGGIHCMCAAIGTCCAFKLTDGWQGQDKTLTV